MSHDQYDLNGSLRIPTQNITEKMVMKRFYLAGQRYFGNRGCEALVRTTGQMLRLREEFAEVEFLTRSVDASLDHKQ